MTVKEAKKILEENGLVLKLNVENEKEIDKSKVTIKNQIPKQGITSEKGSSVLCDI